MGKNKIIIFGGQGNVRELDLKKISRQPEVVGLLQEINEVDEETGEVLHGILFGNEKIDSVFKSILSTFFYNEYYVRKLNNQKEMTYATAHSAGIFNLILFKGYCDLKETLQLIKQRSELLSTRDFGAVMYFFMCSDFETLEQLLEQHKELDVYISIITDETSGVIVGNVKHLEQLKQLMLTEGVKLIYKKSNISVPYHSRFLECVQQEYKELIESFELCDTKSKNDSQFIFEKEHTLEEEIIEQLTFVFNWKEIKNKIGCLGVEEVYDSSPNKFITKQLKKINLQSNYL